MLKLIFQMNNPEIVNEKIIRVSDILEQINELNKMIELHSGDSGSSSMLSQYEIMKEEFEEELNTILKDFQISRNTKMVEVVREVPTKYKKARAVHPKVKKNSKNLDKAKASKKNIIVAKDDLKIIKGIGPKIEGLLYKEGIYTLSKLSNSKIIDLKKLLHKAGPRFKIYDPSLWIKSAKIAAKKNQKKKIKK